MIARLLVAAGLSMPLAALAGEMLAGRVVGVSDGDTITVLADGKQRYKMRLAGIDAPESRQPFGQRSKASLSALVFGREVSAECGKLDRYRRQVCKVIADGQGVNLEQIKSGVAWWPSPSLGHIAAEDPLNNPHGEQR